MFSTESGLPIAIVKDGNADGEIIFFQDNDNNSLVKPAKYVSLESGQFQMIPNERVRVLYFAGPSGSGKSTQVSNYARYYKSLYPDARIILFSRIHDDPAYQDLLYKKIDLTEELIENPLQLEEVHDGSLIIMDDIDTITNKKLLQSIYNFEAQVLEMGRHNDVKLLITSHLINGNDRKRCRTILNEMHAFTFFPESGSSYQIRYCLQQYFGISHREASAILDIKSRWITIIKLYPQLLLSENLCIFLKELK